jgi:hypothetical protein
VTWELAVEHSAQCCRPSNPKAGGSNPPRGTTRRIEEWAHIRHWTSEPQRVAGYARFMHFYNRHSPHGALGWSTPLATLAPCHGNNVPVTHT